MDGRTDGWMHEFYSVSAVIASVEHGITLVCVFVCVAACVLGEGLRGSKSFERGITLTYIFDAACVPGERLRGPQQLPGE